MLKNIPNELKVHAPFTVPLFLAVWIPCCTSEIVFPLVFSKGPTELDLVKTAHTKAARTQAP